MKCFLHRLRIARHVALECVGALLALLPNEGIFYRWRLAYWRRRGFDFGDGCCIARGVAFRGLVRMGRGCCISDNCQFAGQGEAITIGNLVMFGPHCVVVSFDHGSRDLDVPMLHQPCEAAPVSIEDDVWVGANVTVTSGVRLGRGSIVGANSVVTRDVPPYSVVGGVPARILKTRQSVAKAA